MLPIKIDVSELAGEFSLTGKEVSDLKEEILMGLCNDLFVRWRKATVESNLRTSKEEYYQSIQIFRKSDFSGGVELVNKLPNMIESGIDPFDMKEKMLSNESRKNKVKIGSKGQRYITVPFRIGTPGTVGFSTTMSDDVYKVAKSLQGKKQVKQSQLQGGDAIPKTRAFVKTQDKIFDEYVHQSSVFAGLQKGQGKRHGQYHTFRRISDAPQPQGSSPDSWIHKGILARKISDKALSDMEDHVEKIVGDIQNNFLDQILE